LTRQAFPFCIKALCRLPFAITACKKIVDEFLVQNYSVGMTTEYLYQIYTMFGEDPFIISETPKSLFSAWNYAKQRCAEICAG
jgi:hypothetical protein